MFPSNCSRNGNDPISYSDQAFCCRPIFNDSNPYSKRENVHAPTPPPLSFLHFPSPFEDDEIFLQQHQDLLLNHQSLAETVVSMDVSTKIPSKGHRMSMEQIPRKKSCKRDRHSKINTARGLRDRRMRLSLEVAKSFFGLQDMLGFDKASKTVEWLLNQAKDEIKQLAREKNHLSCSSTAGVKSASSTSECEGVSGLDEVAVSGNREQEGEPSVRKRIKLSRKSAFRPLARETREKARERARKRTLEKMRSRRLADESKTKQCSDQKTNSLSQLGSWNPFETRTESGTQSQNMNLSLDVLTEAEERSSQAKEHLRTVDDITHDDSLDMSKWSPTMIFNSLTNSGLLQEHQFGEFQFLGKHWEAYNNHI
ncbi:hypothetical protein L6164_014426 [Bauhinia variegata]|uniref:Uncharacterized protein n=1 Tax=Bauhinia variegata TaxID=167791 RepID=A0ACB9NHC7_BAUVA|nr:hypothetical protein L6164_014426 [Bauhinia variegata]